MSFGSSGLLLLPQGEIAVGWDTSKRKKKRNRKSIPEDFHTLSEHWKSPLLLVELVLKGFPWSTFCTLSPSSGSQVVFWADGMPEGKDGKFTISLVALQILVFFPNLPATVYFSGSSNDCSMHFVRFYSYIQ